MRLRIPRRRATVRDLHSRLQHASRRDDVRLVRRITVVIALRVHHVPVDVLQARWGLRISGLYPWRQDCLLRGLDRVVSPQSGGRRPQWTPRQKKRVVERLEAGPQVVGGAPACGTAGRIRGLSWRECGVLYNCQSVWTLLPTWGCALQQARGVAAHLAAAPPRAGRAAQWPAIVRAPPRRGGLLLCEDAASVAPWGSLSDPWARRGRQPEGPTSGKRKGYKGFGAMASCSGRLFSQGMEGRLHSESSHGVVQRIREHPPQPLWRLHDGAREHPRAATHAFLAAHRDRIPVAPRPSYAPDSHPIAYLWKKTKKRATPHQSGKACAWVTVSVDKALAYCATRPETV